MRLSKCPSFRSGIFNLRKLGSLSLKVDKAGRLTYVGKPPRLALMRVKCLREGAVFKFIFRYVPEDLSNARPSFWSLCRKVSRERPSQRAARS